MYINYNSLGASNSHLRFFANGTTQRMFIDASNGNVTVGNNTNSNNAKLNIIGSAGNFTNTYRYHSISGTGGPCNNCTASYSLYTDGRIWVGGELNVTSDERTKTIIGISDRKSDLELVNKLEVVDYKYIDKINKGEHTVKGFRAQQVEQIYPDAVNLNKEVIPNIYQVAKNVLVVNGTLTLEIEGVNLKDFLSKKIKLIGDFGENFYTISSVTENTITIENFEENSDWIFVYGTEENDVRNLDYNKIFSAGISAIQELTQKVEKLELENVTLKSKLNEIETLKSDLVEIKSLLNSQTSK
jgi:hypothetical protein